MACELLYFGQRPEVAKYSVAAGARHLSGPLLSSQHKCWLCSLHDHTRLRGVPAWLKHRALLLAVRPHSDRSLFTIMMTHPLCSALGKFFSLLLCPLFGAAEALHNVLRSLLCALCGLASFVLELVCCFLGLLLGFLLCLFGPLLQGMPRPYDVSSHGAFMAATLHDKELVPADILRMYGLPYALL